MPEPVRLPSVPSLIDRASAILARVPQADPGSRTDGVEKFLQVNVAGLGEFYLLSENGKNETVAGSMHIQRLPDDMPSSDIDPELRVLDYALRMDLVSFYPDGSASPRDPDTLTRVGTILAAAEAALGLG